MSSFPQPPESFDPIRSYDRPNVFLTQMIEDEASFESFRNTFLMPSNLSPKQRNSYTDKIKDSMGRNALSDSLVDIATNPFTYLMFLATPPAFKSLATTGKVITGGAYNAFLKEKGGLLRMLGFTSASIETAGTPVIPVIQSINNALKKGDMEELEFLGDATEKVLKKVNDELGTSLKSLDPNKTSDPVAKALLHKINDAKFIRMSGWDKRQQDLKRTGLSARDTEEYVIGPYANPDSGIDEVLLQGDFTKKEIKNLKQQVNERNEALDYYMEKMKAKGLDPRTSPIDEEIWEETIPKRIQGKVSPANSTFNYEWALPQPKELVDRPAPGVSRPYAVIESPVSYAVEAKQGPLANKKIIQRSNVTLENQFQAGDMVPRYLVQTDLGKKTGTTLPKILDRSVRRDPAIIVRPDLVDEVIKQYDMQDFLDSSKRFMDHRKVKMFFKEDVYQRTGELLPDTNKIFRYAGTLANKEGADAARLFREDMQSSGVITELMSDEILDFVSKNPGKQKELSKLLGDFIVETTNDPNYFPRNLIRTIGQDGKEVAQDLIRGRAGRFASDAEVVAAKTSNELNWDGNDLVRMADTFAPAKRGPGIYEPSQFQFYAEDVLEKQQRRLADKTTPNEITVRGINFNESLRRYSDKTNRSIALHAEPLSVRTVSALNESLGDDTVKRMTTKFAPFRRGFDKDRQMTLEESVGDRQVGDTLPLGGLSNYDVLTASVGSLKGQKTKDFINNDVLPMVMGERTIEDSVYKSAIDSTRETFGWLAGGPIGEGLSKLGPWGKQFRDEILRFSKDDQAIGSLSSVSGTLAKGLYVSHLGLNMGSVTLNMLFIHSL